MQQTYLFAFIVILHVDRLDGIIPLFSSITIVVTDPVKILRPAAGGRTFGPPNIYLASRQVVEHLSRRSHNWSMKKTKKNYLAQRPIHVRAKPSAVNISQTCQKNRSDALLFVRCEEKRDKITKHDQLSESPESATQTTIDLGLNLKSG